MQIATESVQQIQRVTLETFLKSLSNFSAFFPLNSNNVKLWFPGKELNLIMGMFSICCLAPGGRVCRPRKPSPVTLELPPLGAKPLLSQKELWGFPFDVVRDYCTPPCGRMLRARWSVCAHVSVFACAAVHVTWRGDSSQRAAGTDVWLPLTVHSRRDWSAEGPTPGAPFPRDKS